MKFTPKEIEENVNVSKTHPLVEFFWLAGGLLLVVGIVFLTLGLLTDLAVSRTSPKIENWLGTHLSFEMKGEANPALQRRFDDLLTTLPEDSPLREYEFTIDLVDSDIVNAFAIPGGKIAVYRGLVDRVESENELAMVLYHELGHFAHRDHLRGLGRGLGLAVGSALLFGNDSGAADLVAKTLLSFQANYTQDQESAADGFALEQLANHYGHVGGATVFFDRLAKENSNKTSHLKYLLASHPHPRDRIDAINNLIKENGYPVEATTQLAKGILLKENFQ
ncbi:M48 family metallopeptidase [Desulfosediminicola sp.]|uniref:M48 family metallopeptidase n=1 Tax=Desulfosediminicola sp. TaxID=2886825 RepID=UPI003AF235F7